jgi:signal transduction histidine kinase
MSSQAPGQNVGDCCLELDQALKVMAIGALSLGIAHDLNNLLTPIIISLSDLQERPGVGSVSHQRKIRRSLACAEKAGLLIRRIQRFALTQAPKETLINLPDLLRGFCGLITASLMPSPTIVLDVPARLPTVLICRSLLELVLLSVVADAREAMRDGGTITISAVEEPLLDEHTELPFKRLIRLSIREIDVWLGEPVLRRVADSYFFAETQSVGAERLCMARELTTQLGGKFLVTSTQESGTTIDVWLPVAGVAGDHDVDPAESE